MKDKNVAGILSLFFGWLGIHRFYLGQTGLGILYILISWTTISFWISLVDAIVFFSMDKEAFDIKYNRKYYQAIPRSQPARPANTSYRKEYSNRPQPRPVVRENPHKKKGIEKYKDYDYDGAIEAFKKALDLEPNDIAVHFNLACSYSLNENAERAFYHLDRAVELGFNDFDRIKEHDALAYLRIQDEFEQFEKDGFRLSVKSKPQTETPQTEEEPLPENPDLLEQLQKLSELREKGLLTETEFVSQKRKLMD